MIFEVEKKTSDGQFNMTPIIDIVFLLIIFFMIVCTFIVAENFEVTVPDDIDSARPADTAAKGTTVTVMFDEAGQVAFAIGAELIDTSSRNQIAGDIAAAIDRQMQTLSADQRTVTLRIDKDILFENTQYALAGISQSTATDIKLAVIGQKRAGTLR